jgi:hypothetical protein
MNLERFALLPVEEPRPPSSGVLLDLVTLPSHRTIRERKSPNHQPGSILPHPLGFEKGEWGGVSLLKSPNSAVQSPQDIFPAFFHRECLVAAGPFITKLKGIL